MQYWGMTLNLHVGHTTDIKGKEKIGAITWGK